MNILRESKYIIIFVYKCILNNSEPTSKRLMRTILLFSLNASNSVSKAVGPLNLQCYSYAHRRASSTVISCALNIVSFKTTMCLEVLHKYSYKKISNARKSSSIEAIFGENSSPPCLNVSVQDYKYVFGFRR